MANARTNPVIDHVRRFAAAHLAATLADAPLLERFVSRRDEAAFAALVRRHGSLVLAACRRVLGDPHAAEDCFQATFLVLARKAGSLKRPEALGPWLYGVATRTALKARARAEQRRVCERQAAVPEAVEHADGLAWRDLRPILDEAIAGLPEKYRAPFVLHHLQGLTVAEVAGRLGCPQGTAAARLARAKERLRGRLARRGLALCAGGLAAALAQGAALAAVSTPLAAGTVGAAMAVAAGKAVGALSATAAVLSKGGLQAMSVSKVKVGLAVLLTISAFGVGVGVSRHEGAGRRQAGADQASTPGAWEANARKRPLGHAPAVERYYAGGLRSLRGFAFRGVPPKAGSPRGGCEEPDAPDREAKDLRVDVEEQRTGSLMFGLGVNSDAGLVGSVVLNEKNFDILRPPTCLDDLLRGRAWRGAGQEFRMEAVPGTQRQRHSVSFRDPLYAVAFLDTGTVERDVSIHDYRVSAGVGLRITVPMLGPVPVKMDFGFPLVKGPEERQRLFSFWIGCFS